MRLFLEVLILIKFVVSIEFDNISIPMKYQWILYQYFNNSDNKPFFDIPNLSTSAIDLAISSIPQQSNFLDDCEPIDQNNEITLDHIQSIDRDKTNINDSLSEFFFQELETSDSLSSNSKKLEIQESITESISFVTETNVFENISSGESYKSAGIETTLPTRAYIKVNKIIDLITPYLKPDQKTIDLYTLWNILSNYFSFCDQENPDGVNITLSTDQLYDIMDMLTEFLPENESEIEVQSFQTILYDYFGSPEEISKNNLAIESTSSIDIESIVQIIGAREVNEAPIIHHPESSFAYGRNESTVIHLTSGIVQPANQFQSIINSMLASLYEQLPSGEQTILSSCQSFIPANTSPIVKEIIDVVPSYTLSLVSSVEASLSAIDDAEITPSQTSRSESDSIAQKESSINPSGEVVVSKNESCVSNYKSSHDGYFQQLITATITTCSATTTSEPRKEEGGLEISKNQEIDNDNTQKFGNQFTAGGHRLTTKLSTSTSTATKIQNMVSHKIPKPSSSSLSSSSSSNRIDNHGISPVRGVLRVAHNIFESTEALEIPISISGGSFNGPSLLIIILTALFFVP